MIVYCTACSKNKSKVLRAEKSIKRYLSERINHIYEKSKKDRVGFRIFSGKYGLLKPSQKIFYYNQKLSSEKVPVMVELLKKQIRAQKITGIIFFAYNAEKHKSWKPYLKALKSSCREVKIIWKVRYL